MLSVLAAMLMQAASPASSQAAAGGPSAPTSVTDASWLRKPKADDMARVFPERAVRANQGGRAAITCAVTATGDLENCRVTEESPADFGFGEAALKLAPLFKMLPTTKTGESVAGGTINIPIRFLLPHGESDTYSTELSCYGQAAAFVDKHPDSAEAWTAVTFFSAQVAAQTALAGSSPTQFELYLQGAHRAASVAKTVSPYDPALRSCLDFALKNMKPVSLPKAK